MNVSSSDIAITVILPEASVVHLMETLFPLIPGICSGENKAPAPADMTVSKPTSQNPILSGAAGRPEKYKCEVMGSILSGSTLPEVFAAVVDQIDELDPAVLEKLSVMRPSDARNYISRNKEKVHIRTPRLATLSTKSGWWTSKNISRPQLVGALRALCRAAGLEYGKDLRLL